MSQILQIPVLFYKTLSNISFLFIDNQQDFAVARRHKKSQLRRDWLNSITFTTGR